MFESLISLVVATTLFLGSPGPAPLALAGVGATFGIKPGLPFLTGILLGLAVAIVGATLGLATLFSAFPDVKLAVQIAGALYILYVAQKIARAPVIAVNDAASQTAPRLIDGFILNLLNPKAYAAFFALFSQFILPLKGALLSHVATGIVCFSVAVVVDAVWLVLGRLIRPLFETPRSARIMRVSFALLMVAAVIWAMFK